MKTTFSRTFVPTALLLLIALLLVGLSLQILVKNYLNDQAVEGLKVDASTISDLASAYYTDGALSSQDFLINLSVTSQVSGADAIICDRTGRVLLCSDAPLGCQHQGMWVDNAYLTQVLQEGCVTSTGLVEHFYSDARYVVSVPILDASGGVVGLVIASTPMTQTLLVLKRMSDIFLFVSVLVVVTAVFLITLVARRISSPLRDMAHTAVAFGHGALDARVTEDEHSPEEIRELALAFNNMADSLQSSEYRRREFVANVSHELKTPMTTISGYVDGMLDGTIPPEKHEHYMRIVSSETKRLSRLVRSMLDISLLQDQSGVLEEHKSRFSLEECAGQVLFSFEQKVNQKGLQVQVEFPEHPVYTFANRDAITQVLYNLVDNAVKFCPDGGALGVRIHAGGEKIYVTISNEGNTIPPEELPLVFDRFHKLDKSRAKQDGWGLGLYIVKTIIGSHGEDISVTSSDGVTAFTFTLPLVS